MSVPTPSPLSKWRTWYLWAIGPMQSVSSAIFNRCTTNWKSLKSYKSPTSVPSKNEKPTAKAWLYINCFFNALFWLFSETIVQIVWAADWRKAKLYVTIFWLQICLCCINTEKLTKWLNSFPGFTDTYQQKGQNLSRTLFVINLQLLPANCPLEMMIGCLTQF